MTGPQPFSSAKKFTAENDIERHHLPDNMIASSNLDLGEWLYPIKAGEECLRIETFGKPWYHCPDSQVKEGCTEKLFELGYSTGFENVWELECENGKGIQFRQYVDVTEEMSLETYDSFLDVYIRLPDLMNHEFLHEFNGSGSGRMYYSTKDHTLGEVW